MHNIIKIPVAGIVSMAVGINKTELATFIAVTASPETCIKATVLTVLKSNVNIC